MNEFVAAAMMVVGLAIAYLFYRVAMQVLAAPPTPVPTGSRSSTGWSRPWRRSGTADPDAAPAPPTADQDEARDQQ